MRCRCCPACFRIPPASFTSTARARAKSSIRSTALMSPIRHRPISDAHQRGCPAVRGRGQQPLFHRVWQEFGRCHQPAHRHGRRPLARHGTDPFPGLQERKGIHLSNWTPRGIASGPIRKGKAWFMDAVEAEYDLAISPNSPPAPTVPRYCAGATFLKYRLTFLRITTLQ